MNLSDIRAQLEAELTWRQDEMRLLRNQLSNINNEDEKKRYRKALVVMLYSHYEGFSKIAFDIYVGAINQEHVCCSDVNDYIITLSFADIFKALEIPNSKCKIFKPILPDDAKLHRFCRQVNFISGLNNFLNAQVNIPGSVIDTESNLSREVLRKTLFRLGFPYNAFEKHEYQIKDLLEARNGIAHGSYQGGIDEDVYIKFEKFTYEIMSELTDIIMQALIDQIHLKRT